MKIKVGIVDDRKLNVENLTMFLNQEYENLIIRGFTDSITALNEIVNDEDFDILIIDVIMPGLDGLALKEEILKTYKPKIILMSTAINCKMINNFKKHDYEIDKPIRFSKLKQIVDDAIKKVEYEKTKVIKKEVRDIFKNKDAKTIKHKSFLKDVISILLYDEEAKQGTIYKQLSSEMDRDTSSIRKYLKNIINKIDPIIMNEKFGFVSKPKNYEFLNRCINMVEKNIKKDKQKKVMNK